MALDRPIFILDVPNPSSKITNAMWWFWLRLNELEPTTQLGGIYANKAHFHNTGEANLQNWPTSYSIRDLPNRTGPWWLKFASAFDWTFPEAQSGNYNRIAKYSKRLYDSMKDSNDPRLDKTMYQFFGQTDNDGTVEGYNEYREENSSSDKSHLWHIHGEIFRLVCGDFWAMWAILTVIMGWTVTQWRASLVSEDNMFCAFTEPAVYNANSEAMQLALIRSGYTTRPDGKPFVADGKYGTNTAVALVAQIGDIAGDGKTYGPKQYDALMAKSYKGIKGDKGDTGPEGPMPSTVTFTLPAENVVATVEG